ncbi:MAG: N-acetyl-gamma-glutamyl-phosphate reductase [Bacteroidota bacterium]
MINIGIVGGAGYTAGELIRILLHHPAVRILFVHSSSNAGNRVDQVHQDLLGESDLIFSDEISEDIEVLFLCMGHGKSKLFLEQKSLPERIKIIDLSRDFRLKSDAGNYIYGLVELNKASIQQANRIANPGCFATAMQLALLPLAAAGLLREDIHLQGITGSTGAGQKLSPTSHFSWRNNNVSLYKTLRHQHMDEVRQSISQLQSNYAGELHFIPMRGNFTRGILVSAYTRTDASEAQLRSLYQDYYQEAAFTFISPTNPDLKQVVNTNKAILFIEKVKDQVVVVSLIDNLLKGASGQAVQNMNLMFGLEERMGLELKSTGF